MAIIKWENKQKNIYIPNLTSNLSNLYLKIYKNIFVKFLQSLNLLKLLNEVPLHLSIDGQQLQITYKRQIGPNWV